MIEFWTMLRREYSTRVMRRRFVVSTILTPVFWVVPFLLPLLLINFAARERAVTVLDQSGDPELFHIIKENITKAGTTGTQFNLVQELVAPDWDIEEIRLSLNKEVSQNPDRAYLVLRKDILDGQNAQYYANNVTDLSISVLNNAVSTAITRRRLAHDGLDPAKIGSYGNQLNMAAIKVGPEGESADAGQSFLLSLLVILSIFMTVSGYSAIVMHGVMEEKQSRIIELLATSAEPYDIMASKLIGVGLVGLTQYGIWGVMIVLLRFVGSSALSVAGLSIPTIPFSLVVYCAVFFLLGYFLIATLYLIIGAMASKPEDAEQVRRPLLLLNMIPLFVFWIILQNPASNLSVTISMIPFFAPTMMTMRIALGAVPAWQIGLCILIMIATILGAVLIASKIYRMGLLLYGKKISLTEVGRWLRYT